MAFIELKDAGKSYGSRNVLSGVNLTLEEGEFVSIVGASASGKTTLLKAAAGLILPDKGSVMMGGEKVTGFSLQDLVLEFWEKDRKTCILVTHDIDEALYLSDRIILMTDGPESKVGLELPISLPRPRDRRELADNQQYYQIRKEVIDFLEHHSKQFTRQEAA